MFRLGILSAFLGLVVACARPLLPNNDSATAPVGPQNPQSTSFPNLWIDPCQGLRQGLTNAAQTIHLWPSVGKYRLQIINAQTFSPQERFSLCQDVQAINGFQLSRFANLPHFWEQVFGTSDAGVELYLSERVRYLVENESYEQNSQETVLAANLGFGYFLTYLQNFTDIYKNNFVINGVKQWLQFNDPRVGLVEIHPDYSSPRSFSKNVQSIQNSFLNLSISRLVTLIHEGRHSDCTGGIRRSLLNRYQQTRDQSLLNQSQCGHLHIKCPPGHELEGRLSCDQNIWDAYGVAALFAKIFTQCSTCSELERQTALFEMTEALNRVSPIAVDLFNRGMAPAPDLSSEVRIVEGQ